MITALDTNVLLDVFLADPQYGEQSVSAISLCQRHGAMIVSEPVVTELSVSAPEGENLSEFLESFGINFIPMNFQACRAAGEMWRGYRLRGGKRSRVVADFMIAGHAVTHADRLLTRDSDFSKGFFKGLEVVSPANILKT